MNIPLQPNEPRRLDAQAIQVLRQVATAFALLNSAAKAKNDEGRGEFGSDAITAMLSDAVGRSQGGIATAANKPQERADAFAAHLVWLAEAPLLPGRSYLLKVGSQTIGAMVTELKYRVDFDTLDHLAAKELHSREIAFVNIATAEPISFNPYEENRPTGCFILIDRHSNATVCAGLIRFGLRRAANTYFQSFEVTKAARTQLRGHKPALLWFTGLSGAGKSTIANSLEKKLHALGKHTFVLDGDNVRHGLNRDLGFTDADRVENIRRVGEVAKLMTEAGLIVLCSFISPFRAERRMVRELTHPTAFIEIFVDTPLDECIRRDPKGLYAKAKAGRLEHFTGLDSPYEAPEAPELRVTTVATTPESVVDHVLDELRRRDII